MIFRNDASSNILWIYWTEDRRRVTEVASILVQPEFFIRKSAMNPNA
ncbi:hypothetical protein J2X69_000126 [Algoriphagus sp. 4150]|nr:hypothetical protein [Algoriphagus sp. 4150]